MTIHLIHENIYYFLQQSNILLHLQNKEKINLDQISHKLNLFKLYLNYQVLFQSFFLRPFFVFMFPHMVLYIQHIKNTYSKVKDKYQDHIYRNLYNS